MATGATEVISADGLRISVTEQGNGRPILIVLPGVTSSAWANVAALSGRKRKVEAQKVLPYFCLTFVRRAADRFAPSGVGAVMNTEAEPQFRPNRADTNRPQRRSREGLIPQGGLRILPVHVTVASSVPDTLRTPGREPSASRFSGPGCRSRCGLLLARLPAAPKAPKRVERPAKITTWLRALPGSNEPNDHLRRSWTGGRRQLERTPKTFMSPDSRARMTQRSWTRSSPSGVDPLSLR